LTLGISCLTFLPMNTKLAGRSMTRLSRERTATCHGSVIHEIIIFSLPARRAIHPLEVTFASAIRSRGGRRCEDRSFYQRPRKSRVACEVNSEIGSAREGERESRKSEDISENARENVRIREFPNFSMYERRSEIELWLDRWRSFSLIVRYSKRTRVPRFCESSLVFNCFRV